VRRDETRFSKKLMPSTAKTAGCRRFRRPDEREIYPRAERLCANFLFNAAFLPRAQPKNHSFSLQDNLLTRTFVQLKRAKTLI
jgi:hypothetical protein